MKSAINKNNNNNKGIVITQTPFRISFFGGGTDFPHFFNVHSKREIDSAQFDRDKI